MVSGPQPFTVGGKVVQAECWAVPKHAPVYSPAEDSECPDWYGYGFPCPRCQAAEADEAHRGCEHARHRAWRRWRVTGRLAGFLYLSGITSGGGSWRMGGGCDGCRTLPGFNRNRRVYVLWVKRDTWRCLLRGRHTPGDPVGLGFCSKCVPCPDCGSRTAGHETGCQL